MYISQDPIRLDGGLNLYSYVHDPNGWLYIFGLSTVYLRNKEPYVGKAKENAKGRYGNTTTATDIITGITTDGVSTKKPGGGDLTNTDVAQGVEQIVYERMKVMENDGKFTTDMTNGQRPVNMSDKKKTYRRDAGEEWLLNKYGSKQAYQDAIDKKINEHYTKQGLCRK